VTISQARTNRRGDRAASGWDTKERLLGRDVLIGRGLTALSPSSGADKAPEVTFPNGRSGAMTPRIKKLIGMVALVVGVTVYALIVMMVGQFRLAQSGPLIQLVYFAVFGLIWIVPAALLIRWMERVNPKP
jgi:hypothetical protein